ncbi:unnamed protein product [Meloidogyne enterolobii]|uniref:Uncharacterized protein n=1 Tax=Meloidogyne enterolobii TaxID=390850 RepID=A0ACB1ANC1_MELEN
MPEECRKRISETNKIILIEKEEEEIKENKENNDYWNDLINERNVTLKNNGNCGYLRIYILIVFICLNFLIFKF